MGIYDFRRYSIRERQAATVAVHAIAMVLVRWLEGSRHRTSVGRDVSSAKVRFPFLERLDDFHELLIVDLVVEFWSI